MKDDLEKIYIDYSKKVYAYVWRLSGDPIMAEDIVQDTFLKAYQSLDGFKNESSFLTWLCEIAKNIYFSYLRSRSRKTEIPLDDEIRYENDQAQVIEQETVREIYDLIRKLKHPYREVFLLRYEDEISFDAIGSMFGKSSNWARITYYRARQELQEKVTEGELL